MHLYTVAENTDLGEEVDAFVPLSEVWVILRERDRTAGAAECPAWCDLEGRTEQNTLQP